jgi:hypothetical protein
MVARMLSSSSSSRASACSGLSPASILPPGNSHLQRHRLIGAALTDQDFAAAHDQRRRHEAQARDRQGEDWVSAGLLPRFLV